MKEYVRCELLDSQSSQRDIKKRPKKRNKSQKNKRLQSLTENSEKWDDKGSQRKVYRHQKHQIKEKNEKDSPKCRCGAHRRCCYQRSRGCDC